MNPGKRGIRPNCLEGTRTDILKEIYAWAEDSSQQNILWLSGSPGTGKSAITSTVVSHLSKQQPTVAFCFERGHAILGDPAALWRTIAFGLACHDSAIQNDIVDVINDPKMDLNNGIMYHFKHLIEEPLTRNYKVFAVNHPLVIVVDALDECNSSNSTSAPRQFLLQTFRKWTKLSKQFKLLVAARPESDISRCLDDISQHIVLETGDKVTPQTSHDIRYFLEHHFSKIAMDYHPKLSTWPEPAAIDQLTKQAAGLFIWAETVIRFMKQGVPTKQLSLILNGNLATADIDSLYLTILQSSFENSTLEAFNVVVGCIILAHLPLTCHDLEKLLYGVETDISIAFVLDRVKPVISNDNENGLQITHQSFVDFLKDTKRSTKAFAIDQAKQSKRLALGCLSTMIGQGGLRFNICNLDTSYIFNDQIVDLETYIKAAIPSHLVYACCFWAEHIQDIPEHSLDLEMLDKVHTFAYHHLLHWLEVLSLINEFSIASRALNAACQCFWVSTMARFPGFED